LLCAIRVVLIKFTLVYEKLEQGPFSSFRFALSNENAPDQLLDTSDKIYLLGLLQAQSGRRFEQNLRPLPYKKKLYISRFFGYRTPSSKGNRFLATMIYQPRLKIAQKRRYNNYYSNLKRKKTNKILSSSTSVGSQFSLKVGGNGPSCKNTQIPGSDCKQSI